MNLRDRIRDWLGITEILNCQHTDRQLLMAQSERLGKVQTQISAITPGLGRIIAKLDPNFASPEIDPWRKAESDAIGEMVERRLRAEAAARAPYNHDLGTKP